MAGDDISFVKEVAQDAGKILIEYWHERKKLSVLCKATGEFVSQADCASERYLRQRLLSAFPEDGWMGEETGTREAGPRRWIVDPLDGTTNFLRGLDHWAISIALEDAGELTLGVVHDPIRQETFSAQIGKGAWLNNEPVSVAQTRDMSHALFGTGVPFGAMTHIEDHASDIARLMPHCAGLRRMGAASLDLCYVATGRLDGFWERRLQLWDIAAGLVLLREAGARVEGWRQDERPEESGTIVTAVPELFPAFSASLRYASQGV